MKLILPKLSALAFVATSGTCAHEQPSSISSVIREPDSGAMVALQAACEDGWEAGERDIQRLWNRNGSNCRNARRLDEEADQIKDDNYPESNIDYWFNQCARDGIDAKVNRIKDDCIENGGQCTDFGELAAELVVKTNHCPPPTSRAGITSRRDYDPACKGAAYSICEEQIPVVVDRWCADWYTTKREISELQDKCERQVNRMVGNDNRNPTRRPTRRPTPRPASRPTRRPTRRPTPRPTRRPTRRPTSEPTRRTSGSRCDSDVIFGGQPRRERERMERSARNGTLKRDYPNVWHNTKQARNLCKHEIGTKECKHMGFCFEDETEDSEEYLNAY